MERPPFENRASRGTLTRALSLSAVGVVFLLCLLRLGSLIADFAVNVPFADQWDFLAPIFEGRGPFASFLHQHGPHRQGLGGVLQWFLYAATGWDVRAEAWLAFALLSGAAILLILASVRIRGRLSVADAAYPLAILAPFHWETMLLTPNIAHSILPFFFACLLVLLHTSPLAPARATVAGLVGALAFFTGFGVCVAGVLGVLHLVILLRRPPHSPAERAGSLVVLTILLIGVLSFFIGYRWQPAVPGWSFPVPDWWNYGRFCADMCASSLGYRTRGISTALVGLALFLGLVAAFALALRSLWAKGRSTAAVSAALLTGTALAYAALTAFGRQPLGAEAAFLWRYRTLMLTGTCGLLLALAALPCPRRVACLPAILALFLGFRVWLDFRPETLAAAVSKGKTAWIAAYLATHDISEANRRSDFWIYPPEQGPGPLPGRLAWLEARHLSFFASPAGRSPDSSPSSFPLHPPGDFPPM